MRIRGVIAAAVLIGATGLSGCAMFGRDNDQPRQQRAAARDAAPSIGVNSFLWRATLDTLSFMPLESADPFGGVIITDWHANATQPNERFKASVFILDTRLRADGVKVSIFRQTRGADGAWVDAATDPDTALQIENAILTRARQLRIATLETRR
jgi:hypothetical protein